jgi:hypothetical protein
MTALLADNCTIFGTDPSELWNKKTISEVWKPAFADTIMDYSYSIDQREIIVAPDGNSALLVEQSTFKKISPKISYRIVSHAVKMGDNRMIDFLSWGFIPENEDISRLNKALE